MQYFSLFGPPDATRRRGWLMLLWLLCFGTAAVAQTTTIGSTAVPVVAPATSSYLYGPIYRSANDAGSTFNWSRYAHLYTPAELNIPAGAVITELAWLKSDAGTVTGNNTFNVLLENSALTTLGTTQTWATLTATTTSVYTSTTQQVTGVAGDYFSVTLAQPFTYTGGNLLVLTDWQKQGTASAAVNFVTNLATGLGLGAANSTALTATTALTSASYGNRRPTLRVTYTPGGPCTAPPTAGTTSATATTVCVGTSVSFSLLGSTYGSGQTYQWQESTNGGTTYTDIAGATSTSYSVASVATTRSFRARLTCSGQSATSTPVTVTVNPATYATLPVIQSFENAWVDGCATRDVPTNNWRNNPNTGDASWRRDDDGTSANWTSPTVGVYTPVASQGGAHSARFHSYYAGAAATGSLDLYVNMTTAGTKRLSFDYLNTAGNDSLVVTVSTDGGATFGAPVLRLGISGTVAQAWISQAAILTSTSATTVVRFRTKVTTTFTSDIGLDNVQVESTAGCLTPVALATTGTSATTAAVTWVGSGTYSVIYGPTGFNPSLPASATNVYSTSTGITGSSYTITGLTASTTYQFYVQQNCAGSTNSGLAGPSTFTTACTTPTYATLPVTESFENTWLSRCDTREAPSNSWRSVPATGNNSWRRDDDGAGGAWTLPTSYLYTPLASQGTHSARFHSGYTLAGVQGSLDLFVNLSAAGAKRLTFDYNNQVGSDSLAVLLSNDGGVTFTRLANYGLSGTGFVNQALSISSTSATAVIRFRGRGDYASNDIGIDNVILESATGCLTPAGLTAVTTQTTAVLSWLPGGTGTYTVVYGPTGFNPATGGTTVSGITGTSTTITGLTPGTPYQFYLTQNCAAGTNSGQAGPGSFSTQIINDDCAGALNVPIQYGTCVTQTSADNTAATASTGVPAPGCASYVGQDIWFKVTVPVSGEVTVQTLPPTAGSPIVDTGMAIYSGTCGTLALVECDDDDSPNGNFSLITLTGRTPGEVLYVRAWEFGGDLSGLIAVCATSPSNCGVPTGPAASNLTNTTATLNWVAPANGLPTGGTYEVEYGTQGFVQGTGTAITGLTTPQVSLTGLSPATGYCFYVRTNCGAANGSSAFVGPTCFTTPLTAPANNEPCGATPLGTATVTATNSGATTSVQTGINTPSCAGGALPKDVWFAFTPTGTSTTLTLTGSAAGAVRIFTSPDCSAGPFNQVFCQGSGTNNTPLGAVTVTGLTANQRYYVAVSGYSGSDTPGTFTIGGTALLTGTKAQINTTALLVYPNPSSTGLLTLSLNGVSGKGQATLLNALGQVVLTKALSGTAEQTLTTRGLATGVYTLRVAVDGQVLTRKVVLE